jgi:hypothetical protein
MSIQSQGITAQMKKTMNLLGLAVAFFGLAIGASGQARADVLLDLINPPTQSDTPFILAFTATDTSTTISIGGYQVPSFEQTTHNGVFAGGVGPNLLGSTWVLVRAPVGSDTSTFNDGTSVPALDFGAVVVGDYDTYSQTFGTTVGQSYTLDFLFSNSSNSSPSGLLVTTTGAVPEPSSLALAGLGGLIGAGYVRSRRKRARLA